MKLVKTVSAALAMSALLIALSGCWKQEVPVEQVGKKVVNTVESVGEPVDYADGSIQAATQGVKP